MSVINTSQNAIDRFFERGIEQVYPSRELFAKALRAGQRLRFYLGADPSRPDLHIGHAVILRRMRVLQDMGHEIIFLIGDFTGRIGDPTGKDAARVQLTSEQVEANAKTYVEQIRKILDFEGENAARLEFNAKWLAKMGFEDLIRLASEFTLQQMIERDMFENRLKQGQPIYLHEFFYPLMQGYDSVAMEVDGEFGGSDQLFNMMTGRTLLKSLKNKEKYVITGPLLLGTDGRKMSKSYENTIALTDSSKDMYGKVMSISDELIVDYFRLATETPLDEIKRTAASLEQGSLHPRDAKMQVARAVTELYHGAEGAAQAEQAFVSTFQQGELPEEMPTETFTEASIGLLELVDRLGFAESRSDAKRLIRGGGIRINGEKAPADMNHQVILSRDGVVVQAGKLRYIKVFGQG